MQFLEERIREYVKEVQRRQYLEKVKIDSIVYCESDYKKNNELPKNVKWNDYKDFSIKNGKLPNSTLNSKDTHIWAKFKLDIPKKFVGKTIHLIEEFDYKSEYFGNPQVLVYIDGKIKGTFDRTHHYLVINPEEYGKEVWFYMYFGEGLLLLKKDFYLGLLDDEVYNLYFDLDVAYDALDAQKDRDTREYQEEKYIINEALNILDLHLDYDTFIKSVKKCREYLKVNFYDKFANMTPVTIDVIGHTHIDVAWLWTFAQTREKTARSFATFIDLLNRYPDFKFMHSTPQVYQYVKEDCPELYEKIKEKVKEGRWQPEGGMWVEADCNVSSGEALVRQFLYGKKFFKEEFGVDNRILWLPDVFGYSANLPQILKKSNIDYFVTSKISWNETNTLPYDIFNWEGIDGTNISSYFLTAQDGKNGISRIVTYNGNVSCQMACGTYKRFQQKNLTSEVMLTYGEGDGGGGPNPTQIERGLRLKNGIGSIPKIKFEQPLAFLDRVFANVKDSRFLPKWSGELYLELHRGTYTSQAKNKKYNRMSEFLFQNVETSSLMAGKLLSNVAYPSDYLDKSWKNVLLCQFHDVLPGSSIRDVYDDTDKIYADLLSSGNKYLDEYRKNIIDNLKCEKGTIVFNNNSFVSSSTIETDSGYIFVENIPPKGYKVVCETKVVTPRVNVNKRTIENKYMKVTFDKNMNISSIYDKENNCELIIQGKVGNDLVAYDDVPKNWENWEISEYYTEKAYHITNVEKVTSFENGEIAGFKVSRKFNNSTIEQDIYLYGHENKICFKTNADIHEHKILFKALFPIDVNTNKARFDIQYGNVERNTHRNTSWDEAKFECVMHKFADISQYDHGVTFINDCKYGCTVDGTTFALTMLKTGTYPDPNADNGHQEFTYELCPHKGDMFTYGNIKKAYELNNKMVCYNVEKTNGTLPSEYSLVNNSLDNVFIETIKKCEYDDSIIIRLNEQFGAKAKGKLSFGFDVSKAYICDLMENELSEITTGNNALEYEIKPYEILTIKVK